MRIAVGSRSKHQKNVTKHSARSFNTQRLLAVSAILLQILATCLLSASPVAAGTPTPASTNKSLADSPTVTTIQTATKPKLSPHI